LFTWVAATTFLKLLVRLALLCVVVAAAGVLSPDPTATGGAIIVVYLASGGEAAGVGLVTFVKLVELDCLALVFERTN
jgi:hypothetical protein